MTAPQEPQRVFSEGDPELPIELRDLLVRILTHHIENASNPHYSDLMSRLWDRCMHLPPDLDVKAPLACLMQQEVEHGLINAQILKGLGVDRVNEPLRQYAFYQPIETFCDLAYFHGLIDRVGMYIGETWDGVPYEPLLRVAKKLHNEETFHANLGMQNLRQICSTPDGLAEANERIHKWWPTALDMFGRSDSEFAEAYVRWGVRKDSNMGLRARFVADTKPMLTKLGIQVPEDRINRRYL
jgi:ring-1,2-phenylacetyl-CoA epoxidase subunit PaaA